MVELVQMYFSYRAGWMCDMQSRQHTMLRKRKYVSRIAYGQGIFKFELV